MNRGLLLLVDDGEKCYNKSIEMIIKEISECEIIKLPKFNNIITKMVDFINSPSGDDFDFEARVPSGERFGELACDLFNEVSSIDDCEIDLSKFKSNIKALHDFAVDTYFYGCVPSGCKIIERIDKYVR